jgi:hypothetical protein
MEDRRIVRKYLTRDPKTKWNIRRPQFRWRHQHTLQEEGTDHVWPNPWRWWWTGMDMEGTSHGQGFASRGYGTSARTVGLHLTSQVQSKSEINFPADSPISSRGLSQI